MALAHQAGDAFAADHRPCFRQRSADAAHAVGLVIGDKCLTNLCNQSGIGLLALADWTSLPAVVTAGGDAECFVHGAYGELGLICFNQHLDDLSVLSPLFVSRVVAFAGMWLFIWTWWYLRRNSISSCRSSALNGSISVADATAEIGCALRIQFKMLVM